MYLKADHEYIWKVSALDDDVLLELVKFEGTIDNCKIIIKMLSPSPPAEDKWKKIFNLDEITYEIIDGDLYISGENNIIKIKTQQHIKLNASLSYSIKFRFGGTNNIYHYCIIDPFIAVRSEDPPPPIV